MNDLRSLPVVGAESTPPTAYNGQSEIANLIRRYEDYDSMSHPVLTAAWLHHRFAQIHPFADGNGRTGRALMNWHLIKHGYLPIAVMSKDRPGYIHALE